MSNETSKGKTRGRKVQIGSLTHVLKTYPCVSKSEKLVIDGQKIKLPAKLWYNLKTKNHLKSIHNRTFLVRPRIVGEVDEIINYLVDTSFPVKRIIFSDHLVELRVQVTEHLRNVKHKNKQKNKKSGNTSPDEQPAASTSITSDLSMAEIKAQYPCVDQEQNIINLADQPVRIAKNKWYNLETSRQIGKIDGRSFFINPRVIGTVELLTQFALVNNLDMTAVVCTPSIKPICEEIEMAVMKREPRVVNCTDIDKMPMREIDSLKPFSFNHLTVPAIITKIIDGDTFHCAMVLDPYLLAVGTPIKVKHRTVMGQNAIVCSSQHREGQRGGHRIDSQIMVKLCIRLYGADAADCAPSTAPKKEREITKIKKDIATQFVQTWAEGCYNRVWLQLMGYDCRSRTLARVYQRGFDNHKSTSDLTSKLLRFKHPTYGAVAVPYHGGNKGEAWIDEL